MKTYFLLDLDDTLYQTRHKCGSTPETDLRTAATHPDGSSLSFTTPQQRELFGHFHQLGVVIPVTARNLESFRRVQLPFHSYVVLDFGAAILNPNGEILNAWDDLIRPQIMTRSAVLESLCEAWRLASERMQLGLRIRVISDFGMPLYVVAKHPEGRTEQLSRLWTAVKSEFPEDGFFVHQNDNNLSVVPTCISKRSAVEYLLNGPLLEHPRLVVGAGDSLSDADFLSVCDFSLIPSRSQLMQTLLEQYRGTIHR